MSKYFDKNRLLLRPDHDNAGSGFDLKDLHQAVSEI